MRSFGIYTLIGAMAMISNPCSGAENNSVHMQMIPLSSDSTSGIEDKYSTFVSTSQEFTRSQSVKSAASGSGAFLNHVYSKLLDDF